MGFLSSLGGLAGGAIGSLFGPAGAVIGYEAGSALGSSADMRQDWKYAKKASDRDLANQLYLMEYQNDYNTPKNQMARLKDAGLNPNLVYGSGGATTLSATGHAPSTRAVTTREVQMNRALDLYQREAQIKNMQAQNDNIEAQNVNVDAQTKLIKAQTRAARADAMMREKDLQIYQDSGIDPNKRGLMAWLPTVVAEASNGSKEAARLVKKVVNSSEFKAGQRAYREAERRGGPGYGLFSSYQLNY